MTDTSQPPGRAPSPAARKVAGARRNPSVYGVEHDAPRWLRNSAGVSWRLLVVILMVALIFFAVGKVQLLFIALFIAFVFTAVLRPFVDFFARFLPRGLATALAIFGGFFVFIGLLAYVAYSVANQWNDLAKQFGQGLTQITDFLESGKLPFTITNDQISQWISNGQDWLQSHAGDLAGQAAAGAGSVVEVFTALALAIFCTAFFLARGQVMWTWFLNQLPARVRPTWKEAAGAGWYTFSGYTRGTVLIALTDGLLAFIALLILGVPLAAPLAVLVIIGAFIPLIGAPLAMVIAKVVALAANGLLNAALVGACIALIGQLEGHIFQPFIMGRQVRLHPVVVALSVTAGTLIAGLLGAVIAVPLIAVCWAIFSRLRTLDPPMEDEDDAASEVEPVEDVEKIQDDEPVHEV